MKVAKKISLTLFLCFVNSTNANMNIKVTPGHCDVISGSWSGSGHVVAMSGMVKCNYNGAGVLTGSDNFTVDMNLTKSGGSLICPGSSDQHLTGTCDDETGLVHIHSNDVDLSGSITGETASLAGTINIEGVKGDLTITLQR